MPNNFERKKPKVSIVVPSFFEKGQDGRIAKNETFWIAYECLMRLIEVTPRNLYELILIDNGCDTLTLYNCKTVDYWKHADVIVRNHKNLGFAPACNQGLNLSRGEFIVLMNNDILLLPNWLETMLKDFEENENIFSPSIGLLMPALVKQKMTFQEALKKKKGDIDMKTNAGRFSPKAEFGSLYMGRKELFRKIGEFRDGYQILDETNFQLGFGEDRWLYREVRMLKKETYRTHNLRIFHVGNVTIGKLKNKDNNREIIDRNRKRLEELKKEHNVE